MKKKDNSWVSSFVGSIVVTLGWQEQKSYNQIFKDFKKVQNKQKEISEGTITEVIENIANILGVSISDEYKRNAVLVYGNPYHPIVTWAIDHQLLPLSRDGTMVGVLASKNFEVVDDLWGIYE